MGFEHGSKRTLIHGLSEMGGANIPHMYTEMMGMKLECFIAHIHADTVLGKSFRINLNYIQLLSGIDTPIFESNADIRYIENNWILHLREYLNNINGNVIITNAWVPNKLRDNDANLMSTFIKLRLSNNELKLINNWRIYFKVNFLSERCNPEGNKIDNYYINRSIGKDDQPENVSTLRWPLQMKPGPKGFLLWKKCLKDCFNMQTNGTINYNLGNWKNSDITILSRKLPYYYHLSTSMLFYPEDDAYISVVPDTVRKSTIHLTFRSQRYTHDTLPLDCIPASITSVRDKNLTVQFHSSQQVINKSNIF